MSATYNYRQTAESRRCRPHAGQAAITVGDRTAAVLVSAVLYANAHIVPNLRAVQEACERVGAELLVDVYHPLNVVP